VERNRQNRSAFAATKPCSYIIVECDIASSIRYQRNYTTYSSLHDLNSEHLPLPIIHCIPRPLSPSSEIPLHHVNAQVIAWLLLPPPLSKSHWQKPQPSPTRAALRRHARPTKTCIGSHRTEWKMWGRVITLYSIG